MKGSQMDDLIKKRLEALEVEYDPSTWSALSSKLDALGDEVMDDSIREGLEKLDVAYDGASWSALAAKMDALNDESLDTVVKEQLESVNEPYDSASWTVLLNRLKEWEDLRRQFFILRAAELLMVLLMLLAFFQYRPILSEYINASGVEDGPMAILDVDEAGNAESTIDLATATSIDKIGETYTTAQDAQADEAEASLLGASVDDEEKSQGEVNAKLSSDVRSQPVGSNSAVKAVTDEGRIITDLSEEILTSSEGAVTSAEISNRTESMLTSDVVRIEMGDMVGSTDSRTALGSLQNIHSMSGSGVVFDVQEEVLLDLPALNLASSNKNIWLSLNSHAAVNQVFTPASEEFDAQQVYTMAYGVGLLVGFEHGPLTWEAGAEYQFGLFKPKRTKLTGSLKNGYRTTTLAGINVDYLNIPLQARYMVWDAGKHEFYLLAGLKLHISSKVDFDFVEEEDPDLGFPGDFTLTQPEEILDVDPGRFTYFSLNGGLGYQYRINERSKVFVQPSFEYFAEKDGIMNLNGEKVNTSRLDFGVRVGI